MKVFHWVLPVLGLFLFYSHQSFSQTCSGSGTAKSTSFCTGELACYCEVSATTSIALGPVQSDAECATAASGNPGCPANSSTTATMSSMNQACFHAREHATEHGELSSPPEGVCDEGCHAEWVGNRSRMVQQAGCCHFAKDWECVPDTP